jgi:hypothetical protein
VSKTDGTLTVDLAALTVTPMDATRLYGAENPVFNGIITGLQNNDNISAEHSTVATLASPIGTYDITGRLLDPDGKAANYIVTLLKGTLTIRNVQPSLKIVSRVNQSFKLSILTDVGVRYTLQAKTELSDPSWAEVQTVTGDGTEQEFADFVVLTGNRFYRVRID